MNTFREAEQVRLGLKMRLSVFAWYKGSNLVPDRDGFAVVIHSRKLDNSVRKLISPVVSGISVKVEI